jgi:hypothetical protein
MDNQLTPPNTPAAPEGPGGFKPEDLKVGGAVGPEAAPAPGAAPAAANSATTTPAPILTAADVAAAIAATPAPGVRPTIPTPGVAGDVDVIEPEWVDKAEEVVRAHHGDPYGEEEAIEELQEDYLQKRYGINVADPNASDTKPKGA